MKNALSCPIDQLHIGGYLACDIENSTALQRIADLRYIAAKRLKSCESSEFSIVSNNFRLQKDLVYCVIRSGNPIPPFPKTWLPALYVALDSAIRYWEMTQDEDEFEDRPDSRDNRRVSGNGSECVLLEPHGVDSRGPVYANH